MVNLLDPDAMSPQERIEEAAALLARGVIRRRLRRADKRKHVLSAAEGKVLDVLRVSSDECVEPQSEKGETHES